MPDNEISKLIESLRIVRDAAEKEPGRELLGLLIEQAFDEAIVEAQRRGQPVPSKPPAIQLIEI